jgi:hypothetical protein
MAREQPSANQSDMWARGQIPGKWVNPRAGGANGEATETPTTIDM